MKSTTKRALVLILGFALVAAVCGDDDTTATQATAAPATQATAGTAAPAATTTTTTAATTAPPATEAAAPTAESVIADHEIPLQPGTELVSLEVMDDGFRVGAIVNSAPPPGYAATLTAAGWEVLDVQFGSEATTAFLESALIGAICLVAYANYGSSSDPSYWFYFFIYTGLTPDDCKAAAADAISLASTFGRP